MKRAQGFRIAGSARHDWERHDVPHSIGDVVDAMFALPPDQLKERHAPTERTDNWNIAHGRVFGQLFFIGGEKNEMGEWTLARIVAPVWPPPQRVPNE